jgi:FAD/FMN-containing dehydrogenase
MMYVLDEEELVPSAMVYPGSTEEVQQIARWANKYCIPISPISMGRNCELSQFQFLSQNLTVGANNWTTKSAMAGLHPAFAAPSWSTWVDE